MPHKNLPDPPEKLGSSKRESTPLKLLSVQSGKAALVSNDTQLFEPISDKSAKPELGRGALAVTGLKENREQGIATPGPATPVKVPETDEVAPKSIAAQTADTQTDAEPHARAMHQIPQVEPEKISELRQRAADGSSSADLSKNNTPRLPSMPSSPPVDPAADLSKNNTPRLPSMPSSPPVDPAADLSKNNTPRLPSMPSSPPVDPAADLSKNNTPAVCLRCHHRRRLTLLRIFRKIIHRVCLRCHHRRRLTLLRIFRKIMHRVCLRCHHRAG